MTNTISKEYQKYLNTFNKAQLQKFISDKRKLRQALTFDLFEASEAGAPTNEIKALRAIQEGLILYAEWLEAGTKA